MHERINSLLKEWELCQKNLEMQNNWLWQTGSIFIILSIAALWTLVQITDQLLREQFFWVLALFSVATIVIWLIFIAQNAIRYSGETRKRLFMIEKELRDTLCFSTPLLHTLIHQKDEGSLGGIFRAKYGVYFFLVLIICVWILAGIAVYS